MVFDEIIERKGTNSMKYDALSEKFGRDDLNPLWVADMDFAICPEISNAIKARVNHPIFGYEFVPDSYWESILKWCKRRHGLMINREEICFMPGIVRGIAYIVNFFTNKGDKILIQPPVYHPFANVTRGNGRIVVNNPLIYNEGKISMDFKDLESKIKSEKPKLMILCNPHNPGGRVWSKEDLEKVAEICYNNGVIVVSDEIHADIELFGNKYTPFLSIGGNAEKCGISLGAPSKTFNIPGLVSSWCVIKNPQIRKDFFEWMEVNEFSEPTLPAVDATKAAYDKGEYWLNDLICYLEQNIIFVEEYLSANIPQIKPIRPEASFLIWLDCHGLGLNNKEVNDLFVNKAKLALNNGEMFGKEGSGFMRLNIACPKANLIKALEALKNAIDK